MPLHNHKTKHRVLLTSDVRSRVHSPLTPHTPTPPSLTFTQCSVPLQEKMEEEKKEEEEKKAGEGGEEGGRSVGIAGLLNDLITGVVDAVGGRLAGHEGVCVCVCVCVHTRV